MYGALATQPDISFTVAGIGGYSSRHFTCHHTVTKWGLQNLKFIADFEVHRSSHIGWNDLLTADMDLDWANQSADWESHGGNIFLLSNGTVLWQSLKDDLIAMSTLKAEYIACSECSCEVKWLPQLPWDIHGKDKSLLLINCHNQGVPGNSTAGIVMARTKHIDIYYHNSPDLHARKIVEYSYMHTNNNVADILMKCISNAKQETFTKAMGLW